ncbi:unnamed protein product [Trifolium pratense]|uniref:Uncharacterized protein n=1 Tax=Trifolium pratense TaxID=57577 RepID=A0ACB0I7M9_TRIPR|nr:unnamed protein product [Trifolium pratense]
MTRVPKVEVKKLSTNTLVQQTYITVPRRYFLVDAMDYILSRMLSLNLMQVLESGGCNHFNYGICVLRSKDLLSCC